jgi:outer membrane lipoprotein SlyB
MDTTKLKLPAGVAALLLCLLLVAIGLDPTRTQIGAVSGAIVGGLAASAVTGGSLPATLAGIVGGAVAGYEIGRRMQ